MAGELIYGDDQYELNGLLMGVPGLLIEGAGVDGWEAEVVKGQIVERTVGPGAVAGWQGPASKPVMVPLLIIEDNEADARDVLDDVRLAWRGSDVDTELHRRVAGVSSYLVGRTMGCVPDMRTVQLGVIAVMCSFLALDPDEVQTS